MNKNVYASFNMNGNAINGIGCRDAVAAGGSMKYENNMLYYHDGGEWIPIGQENATVVMFTNDWDYDGGNLPENVSVDGTYYGNNMDTGAMTSILQAIESGRNILFCRFGSYANGEYAALHHKTNIFMLNDTGKSGIYLYIAIDYYNDGVSMYPIAKMGGMPVPQINI